MARPLAAALDDIASNIELIERFTSGKTEQDYNGDPLLSAAVERCLERISEASRSIPDDVKAKYPAVPWRQIADVGNRLRHNYDSVDDRRVWQIATLDVPALVHTIARIIAARTSAQPEPGVGGR